MLSKTGQTQKGKFFPNEGKQKMKSRMGAKNHGEQEEGLVEGEEQGK